MLKRLFFAVFTLGLVLAFVSMAFADTPKGNLQSERIANTPNTANISDRVQSISTGDQLTYPKTGLNLTERGSDPPQPGVEDVEHYCGIVDYTDYDGAFYSFDLFGDDGDIFVSRFNVLEPKNHVVELYGTQLRIYDTSDGGGVDITVNVYANEGGIPGAVLYSETYPAGSYPLGNTYFAFSTTVDLTGYYSFFIGYTTGGTQSGDAFTTFGLNLGVDNQRALAYFTGDGNWYNMTDYFGYAFNLRITADLCHKYSVCYRDGSLDGGTGWIYYWKMPDPDWWYPGVLDGFAQRFVVANYDTLKYVEVPMLIPAAVDGPGMGYDATSTNSLEVSVWDDDGTGAMDIGSGPIATVIVPAGLANIFPNTGNEYPNALGTAWERLRVDFSSYNLTFNGPIHVSAKMTSGDPADGYTYFATNSSGDNPGFSGGSLNFHDGPDDWTRFPLSALWADMGLDDNAFYATLGLCAVTDEFANCTLQSTYNSDVADWFYTQDGGHDFACLAMAQAIEPLGWASRIQTIRFYCEVKSGTPGVQLNVYDDNGTAFSTGERAPGDIIWDTVLSVANNGWNEVVIPQLNQPGVDIGPGLYVEGKFFVGYQVIQNGADSLDDVIYAVTNEDPGGMLVNGGPYYLHAGAGPGWISFLNYWGYLENLLIDVDFCSIPTEEKICADDDWVTMQHDFQRSGHSGVDLGDPKCFLTYEWDTLAVEGNAQWVGPIIYDGMLVTTFKTTTSCIYTVRDLETKAILYTFTYDGEVRGMPTAYYVDAIGKDVLFVTGGTDTEVVQAIDLATGSPIWTISSNSGAPENMPTGMDDNEINQFSNFIVLNDGADDVLYFTTTLGKVYAVYAADGTEYWTEPFQYPGFGAVNNRTGATNGVDKLFYGYQTTAGGDVVCLDAFAGTENWKLSTDGFHGNDAYGGGVISESFQAGMSADIDPEFQKLYALSTVTGAEPREAVIYQIDYNTGITTNYNVANGVGFYFTPVIDKSRVIVPSFTQVLDSPANPTAVIQSYLKGDLSLEWGLMWGDDVNTTVFNADLLLTCEPEGAADLLFGMDYYGYLRCIDANLGEELFHRRVDYGANDKRGGNGAIGNDASGNTHLVWQSIFGVYDLVMGTEERARLQLVYYANRAPVPFGTATDYAVTFPEVYTNSGCVDLTADIVISDVSNGLEEPPVLTIPASLNTKAQTISDMLANTGRYHKAFVANPLSEEISSETFQNVDDKTPMNPAALADMSWINTPLISTVTAPGDVADITVHVNQSMVGRGVFHFYATFTNMNDNDYWLNILSMTPPPPEVRLDFIGGCLLETTTLEFGDGALNKQACWNNGRLATITDADTTIGFRIDGVTGILFAGNYIMGVSERRLALSNKSWIEGSTEADAWASWLPDLYNGECVPELYADVQLGSWSDDGLSYHPIYGNAVEANSIDSVQNFYDESDSTWKWDWYVAPYDNDSTMGLAIHHRHIGAYDFGQSSSDILQWIGNATVEIMDVTERNGNSVPGWYINSYLDYDFRTSGSGVDTTLWNPTISLGWGFCKTETGARAVGGMMTLPFNFCNDPADPFYKEGMLNAMAVDQRQGMWGAGSGSIPFLDSCYFYMTRPAGLYSHNPLPPSEDMASTFTYTHHDFAPHETYTLAIGYFEFQDYPTPNTSNGKMTQMAYQLNKWMGYGRGDVNNDNKIDLADIIYLANYVNYGGPGPIPFVYLGNLNGASTGAGIDMVDVMYLVNYYFNEGPCPEGILKNTGKATDAADY